MEKVFDWDAVMDTLDTTGYAVVSSLLTADECSRLIGSYENEGLYRSTINMQRYRFGMGEYKYFSYPLPTIVQELRESLYPALSSVANTWMQKLGIEISYPSELNTFLSSCHTMGQVRPAPLILRYEAGGYNTLHQDIYGDVFFPFQVVFMLSQAEEDFTGGELVFVEQVPRAQSRAQVLTPQRGDAVIFTTNFRPVKGMRGYYRATMKHGVSPVRGGRRFTMGIIFHDAK